MWLPVGGGNCDTASQRKKIVRKPADCAKWNGMAMKNSATSSGGRSWGASSCVCVSHSKGRLSGCCGVASADCGLMVYM